MSFERDRRGGGGAAAPAGDTSWAPVRDLRGLALQRRALQRKAARAAGLKQLASDAAASAAEAAAPGAPESGGEELPRPIRRKMEGAFGADFSSVRVHQDGQAESMGAHAFASGDALHFAPGAYDPDGGGGQELLGHELAHVVQQRQGRVAAPQGKGAPVVEDAGLEAEADVDGARAARGEPVVTGGGGGGAAPGAAQCKLKAGQLTPVTLALKAGLEHVGELGIGVGKLLGELVAYGELPDEWPQQHRDDAAKQEMQALLRLKKLVGELRSGVVSAHKTPTQPTGDPLAALGELDKHLAGLQELLDGECDAVSLKSPAARGLLYGDVIEPATLAALEKGESHHLLITPDQGGKVASGAGRMFPEDMPPEERHTLALPGDSRELKGGGKTVFNALPKVKGGGPLDVMVVAGGHGGPGALFEQEAAEVLFSADHWKYVVKQLVDAGVTAKLIVLDACLTASLIDVFSPLLAPDGKIVCSMYSVPMKVVTPEVWGEIHAATQQGQGAQSVVDKRTTEIAQETSHNSAVELVQLVGLADQEEERMATVQELAKGSSELSDCISALYYLPRIADALGKKDAGALEKLLEAEVPRSALDEQLIYACVEAAVAGEKEGGATEAEKQLHARLKQLSGLERPLEELRAKLGDKQGQAELTERHPGAQKLPVQVAVFDQADQTLSYDANFHDDSSHQMVEQSSGMVGQKMNEVAKGDELKRLEQRLLEMIEGGLKPVPRAKFLRGDATASNNSGNLTTTTSQPPVPSKPGGLSQEEVVEKMRSDVERRGKKEKASIAAVENPDVAQLMQMGMDQELAEQFLKEHGSVQKAISAFLGDEPEPPRRHDPPPRGAQAAYSEENVAMLVSMSFERDQAIRALQAHGDNLEAAANSLLG